MLIFVPICTNADSKGQNIRNEGNRAEINEHSPHNRGSVVINGYVKQDCGGTFHTQGSIYNSGGTINSNSPHNNGVVVINGDIKQNCGGSSHTQENIHNNDKTISSDNPHDNQTVGNRNLVQNNSEIIRGFDMNSDILKVLGQFAGIGGVSLGVLLIIFKGIIAKNIFPTLRREDAYNLLKLISILVWTVTIIGILSWVLMSYKEKSSEQGYAIPRASLLEDKRN
jgi:ABC-type antimicrobial peptide transport system permease subunit